MNQVSGFDSVSTYVLDGRRSDLSGDPGEVLDSFESVAQTPCHEIGPLLTCAGYGEHGLVVLVIAGYSFYLRMQYETVEILAEQQIASAADMEYLVVDKLIGARKFQQFLLR